jgi:hypothetical protein
VSKTSKAEPPQEERQVVWVTCFWLKSGVKRAALIRPVSEYDWATVQFADGGTRWGVHMGVDAFYDRRDAILDAKKRRAKRVRAVRRTLERLEAMDFEEAWP